MPRTRTLPFSLLIAALFLPAFAAGGESGPLESPHLELELESRDYRALLEHRFETASPDFGTLADLSDLLDLGTRNLDLLAHLNTRRPADQKLTLTSPSLQPGYPIDAPKESSPRILREKRDAVRAEIPGELRAILFEGVSFPERLELSDDDYLAWARKVDGIYQGASRWTLQEPNLGIYRSRRYLDVRGYYFLTREPNWEQTLSNWSSLDESVKGMFRPWIEGLCVNNESDHRACRTSVREAERSPAGIKDAVGRWLPKARSLWNKFFALGGRRSDVNWKSSQPGLMQLPFADPRSAEVKAFLVDNIEDEWRLPSIGWTLKLAFQPGGGWNWSTPNIVFEPGATPHVNGLGGNTITMDANQPLTEYGTRWTIRHEFGHVLGLPDCYVEFYDDEKEVMVSYQLDLDNLMCSRRGKLQQIHYDELKKAYFR